MDLFKLMSLDSVQFRNESAMQFWLSNTKNPSFHTFPIHGTSFYKFHIVLTKERDRDIREVPHMHNCSLLQSTYTQILFVVAKLLLLGDQKLLETTIHVTSYAHGIQEN